LQCFFVRFLWKASGQLADKAMLDQQNGEFDRYANLQQIAEETPFRRACIVGLMNATGSRWRSGIASGSSGRLTIGANGTVVLSSDLTGVGASNAATSATDRRP
jgi:hypothetical protein